MNSDKDKTPLQKPPLHFVLWWIATILSLLGLLFTAGSIIDGPFPAGFELYVNYFLYSFFILVFLHSLFFTLNGISKHKEGRTLSRNLPRYIEYTYAALISIGLAQVFFMPSQFADYVALRFGDEQEIVNRIIQQASIHLNDDCPKGGIFFPKEYCEKLRKIVDLKEPRQHITSVVINDHEFLNHPILTEFRAAGPGGFANVPVKSPIARDVDALRALKEYGVFPQSTKTSHAFRWIAIILLPLGIGLRVLKTSIELFGDLK